MDRQKTLRGQKVIIFPICASHFSLLYTPHFYCHSCGGRNPEHGRSKANLRHEGHGLSRVSTLRVFCRNDSRPISHSRGGGNPERRHWGADVIHDRSPRNQEPMHCILLLGKMAGMRSICGALMVWPTCAGALDSRLRGNDTTKRLVRLATLKLRLIQKRNGGTTQTWKTFTL